MRIELRLARLVALLASVAGLDACHLLGDCFFSSHGQVVSCTTGEPLEGVMISLHVDEGIHSGSDRQKTFVTDARGTFVADAGGIEECHATVTLKLQRSGFSDQSAQVKGTDSDSAPVEVCMSPAP